MKLYHWAIILFCFLGACAQKQETAPQRISDCPGVYVVLPENFIIDIAADSEVILNPSIQEFQVFCTPIEADKGRVAMQERSPGGWRVYLLEGTFPDLAAPIGNSTFRLARSAKAIDWLPEGSPKD